METLLSLTLSGSALALLLLALGRALRGRLPSTVYYYAWLLVLLRFLLPLPGLIPTGPSTAVPTPAAQERLILHRDRGTALPEPAEEDWLPAAEGAASAPTAQEPAAPAAPAEAAAETPVEPPAPVAAPASRSFDWTSPRLWLGVWGLGGLLSLGWPVFSYLRFTRSLRRQCREPEDALLALYASLPGKKPALYTCAALKTPLMFGVLAPKIVLPAGISDPALWENILRHELTHYRRRDPLYKWFAAAVLALHWFNPLSWLIRRELNRACELSCDETLLRSMDRAQKQAYGETLLRMAASSALPAGVVATTFSTEKKNLKERLEQIMHYKKSKARVLAAVLALLLLCGCGAVAGPAEDAGTDAAIVTADTPEPAAEGGVVQVSDVDGLLAAIAPNTSIELAPGVYDLSTASNYGEESSSEYYSWNRLTGEAPNTPSYELEIRNVEGLSLRGAGREDTTIAAVPRHADVIRFVGCRDLTVSDLTAGHTEAPGICAGGVLRFDACNDVTVTACGLFGCGTVGVWAQDCTGLAVTDSRIYECSYAAVDISSCRDVLVQGCEIDRNGIKIEGANAVNLFSASNSDGFTVLNCQIHDNDAQKLLTASYTKNALFLSNLVEGNRIATCLFQLRQYPVTVDGCAFTNNDAPIWIHGNGVFPVDAAGDPLDAEALRAMEYREIDPASVQAAKPLSAAAEVPVGGSVTVSTVDELLAAIGPDRTIVLDGELFDLSTAADYGSFGGAYYYWRENVDGPELVISGVSGLTLRAAGDDPKATTLTAVPRYANVLRFEGCEKLSLVGFTVGHTEGPGECSGGVLDFQNCHEIDLEACRLYGCGILGVSCYACTGFQARDCEIYECSQGGVSMISTDGISFINCDIHDVPNPALRFFSCGDKRWNGAALIGDRFDLDAAGQPESLGPESNIYGAVGVFYYDTEKTEFTLHVGDSVTLNARVFPEERSDGALFTWSVSDGDALRLTPSADSQSCTLEALKAAPGGVTLTVECGGVTQEVMVYIAGTGIA